MCGGCVLMVRINPFIAVSLKSKLLEGYCNACARWAQFSWCHQGGVRILLIIFFIFPSTIRGFLGALTCSKSLENRHTHWNLRSLGRCRGWDPGVAQGLYGAPWKTVRKLDVYLTHTCTYSYEIRYTYRSHWAEQLSRWQAVLRPTRHWGC